MSDQIYYGYVLVLMNPHGFVQHVEGTNGGRAITSRAKAEDQAARLAEKWNRHQDDGDKFTVRVEIIRQSSLQ